MSDPASTADGPVHLWVDGAVVRSDDASLDRAVLDAGLCYTTTRVRRGRALRVHRHAERLARDARLHDLEAPDADEVVRAFQALAAAEFEDGDGVVRLELGRDPSGTTHLVGVPRPLGSEPDAWGVAEAPVVHPGPGARAGAKLCGLHFVEEARGWNQGRGLDEAALFDADGFLVEGTRSNFIVLTADGRPIHPDEELGPVAGIGLQVARLCIAELEPGRLTREDVSSAREIVAVNAVRGARPVVAWNGRRVGDGSPGEFAIELGAAMADVE